MARGLWVLGAVGLLACGGGASGEPGDTDDVSGTVSSGGGPGSGSSTSEGTSASDPSSGGPGDSSDAESEDDATGSTTGEPAPVAAVHFVGRFDADNNSTWSGSTVRTRIDGTTLDVELDGAGGVYFQVVVDGEATDVFITDGGPQTYPMVADLPAGEHDVQLVRRNEGYFGAVQFVGFTPGADTTIVDTPWPYAHRIEYLGDSLTAGYGIECASGADNFSADTESAWPTYAMEAARQVDAAPHLIAFSGKGVFQNYGGDTNEPLPELYPRTLTTNPDPAWDFGSWVADAVVVNLGTNDFSAPIQMADFVGAYTSVLETVRSNYPGALIIAITWVHWGAEFEGWVQAAVDQAGDGNTITERFEIFAADGYGCDYHTNEITNQRFGTQLAATLGTELGW